MLTKTPKTRYQRCFEYWERIQAGGFKDWFDPAIPSALLEADEQPAIYDLIPEMLEAGETYWSHPGWNQDIWRVLEFWAVDNGNLIRVRLTAQWLLSTLPIEPLDPEVRDRLQLLADGDFCSVFEGKCSGLYASREHYLKTLKWNILRYVVDWLARVAVRRSPGC